jgi:hypothetical protein
MCRRRYARHQCKSDSLLRVDRILGSRNRFLCKMSEFYMCVINDILSIFIAVLLEGVPRLLLNCRQIFDQIFEDFIGVLSTKNS